ncbi:MAG: hypothetical protein O3A14_20520 [Cyanobacteria bacterium]|nr:hypothetical protein [Cyanobacteriota bacterium]
MSSNGIQVCPVCRVSVTATGLVIFSAGKPGTRARLYERVCQYTQRPGCINQDAELVGDVTRADGFVRGEDIQLPQTTNPLGTIR